MVLQKYFGEVFFCLFGEQMVEAAKTTLDNLPSSGQCPTVRIKYLDKIAPPQNDWLSGALPFSHCNKACHGYSPGSAIVPFTALLAACPLL